MKFKNITKIAVVPMLLYLTVNMLFNNVYVANYSFILLFISLLSISFLMFNEKLLNKIIKKYNNKIKFISLFLTYFVYKQILLQIVVIIFNITNLDETLLVIIDVGISTVYLFFMYYIYQNDIKDNLKKLKTNYRTYLEVAVPSYIIGFIGMALINLFIIIVLKGQEAGNEVEINKLLVNYPLYVLFLASIFAPIVEELIFRKTLSKLVKNKYLFIVLSGSIFGLLHVIGSYNNLYDLLYILSYGSLGYAFAYIYKKTNNITVPILLHFVHNTTLILIQLIGA